MKKTHALIAAIAFIFGFAAGIIFALVKISKKFEYELETMFAGGGSDDPDIEELYTIDGFNDFSDIDGDE